MDLLCIKMKESEGNLDTINPPNLQVIFSVQLTALHTPK